MAAGRAEDGLLLGRGPERGEGDRARVLREVVVLQERVRPVPAVDGRAQDAVVVEQAHVGRGLKDVDPEDRAPRRVHRLDRGREGLGGVDVLGGEQPGPDHEHRAQGHQEHDDGEELGSPSPGDAQRADRQHQRRQHDGGRGADGGRQVDDDGAGQSRSGQVGEVEAADLVGPATEEGGEDDAGRHERDEHQDAHGDEEAEAAPGGRRPVVPHVEGVDGDVRDEDVGPDHAHRRDREAPQQDAVGAGVAETLGGRHQHPARTDSEQGEADDEVGVVVVQLERDDAGVADLDQERREADQQDLEVVREVALGRGPRLTLGHRRRQHWRRCPRSRHG